MKTKHTSGPWDRKNTGTPTGNPGHLIYAGDRKIAKLVQLDAENYANAKLIAASPTLYAYAQTKSGEGDEEAKKMLASLGLSEKE